ncbi:uncharacterized protein LOC133806732 [Humulus lupulus]|uniref:uncharacterized protein LOC133806732 n=1 Tax=Humulus lupulus TaxID=3486 RepID=UPI002B4053B6|nr:uncharacterized protein LOC133806732 [Humulus lupulus]
MAASSSFKISNTTSVEEQLSRLRTSSEATTTTSTSSSSSSLICNRLSGLKDLHESFDDLLQLQLQAKQALETKKTLEQVLDGSLRLLDSCATTRDIFSMIKQTLQELQSSLRRKRGSDQSGFENEVNSYMLSKKKVLTKMITKCLKNVMMTKDSNNSSSDLFSLVQEATCEVFQSLLGFISRPKIRSSPRSYLALKLFRSRKVACEGEVYIFATQLEKIDATLMVLKANKDIKIVQVKQVLKELESLESTIQELDENLECIFRCLMKTRVSLLNIYTR